MTLPNRGCPWTDKGDVNGDRLDPHRATNPERDHTREIVSISVIIVCTAGSPQLSSTRATCRSPHEPFGERHTYDRTQLLFGAIFHKSSAIPLLIHAFMH